MSSPSSNDALIQKNSGFAISLSKLNKQSKDQLEMNSINSSILLNPSAIKNNQPVINQLYQPILRQDAIDLSTISINTFPTNINPHYLLASFQTQLQPNKLHPYIRPTNSFTGATSTTSKSNTNRTGNSKISSNGQQSVINFNNNSSSSTSTSSNNSYLPHNLRLSDNLNSNLAQINKSNTANTFDNSTNSSRLINDSNWLLNGQLNQLNQFNPSSSHSSSKSSNQPHLNKRITNNRLMNNSKNFMYTDKNTVDSVKKLDKIISNHNKNLQEILRHKNQLIKTITAKQAFSGSRADFLPGQFNQINNLTNLNSHLNNLNNQSNSHLNNLNSSLNNLNSNLVNHQNQFSSLFVNGKGNARNRHSNQSTDFLNNKIANRQDNSNNFLNIQQLNQLKSNRRLNRSNEPIDSNNLNNLNSLNNFKNLNESLQLNNNSLNVLTIAINEEAELNKLKTAKDQKKINNDNKSINESTVNQKKLNTDQQNSLLSEIIDESIINDNLIVNSNDDMMINTLDLINSTINSSFNNNEPKSTNSSKTNLKSSISNNLITNKDEESNLKRKFVSKLDERETRIKKFREDSFESEIFYIDNGDEFDFENGDEISEVQSDCEYNDEYNYRLKSNCILFNPGGKRSPQLTEKKLHYLQLIGLTTEQNKERLEFDKFVRTKRTLKEISNVNPNNLNNSLNSDRNGQRSQRSQTLRSNSLKNQTLRNDLSSKRLTVKSMNSPLSSSICSSLTPMNQLALNESNCELENRSVNSENRSPSDQTLNECLQTMIKRKIENTYLEPTKIQPNQIRDATNRQKTDFMNQIGLQLETSIEKIKLREINWEGCLEDRERRRIFNVCFEKLIDNLDAVTKVNWLKELNEETFTDDLSETLNYNLKNNKNFVGLMSSLNKSSINSKNVNKTTNLIRSISRESLESIRTNQINMIESNVPEMKSTVLTDHFKWPGIDRVIESYGQYHREQDDEQLLCFTKATELHRRKRELEQQLNQLKKDKNDKDKIKTDLESDEDKMKKAKSYLINHIRSIFNTLTGLN